MPNPTDTARALVDELENATKRLTLAEQAQSHFPIQRAMILRDEARAALLAHVAGVEQLATFGAKVLLEFHNHGSRGDVDGGWLQDTAVDSGVMYRTERKIPCCDLCNCRGYLTDGDWSECVPITNQDLVYSLATRPTEARNEK